MIERSTLKQTEESKQQFLQAFCNPQKLYRFYKQNKQLQEKTIFGYIEQHVQEFCAIFDLTTKIQKQQQLCQYIQNLQQDDLNDTSFLASMQVYGGDITKEFWTKFILDQNYAKNQYQLFCDSFKNCGCQLVRKINLSKGQCQYCTKKDQNDGNSSLAMKQYICNLESTLQEKYRLFQRIKEVQDQFDFQQYLDFLDYQKKQQELKSQQQELENQLAQQQNLIIQEDEMMKFQQQMMQATKDTYNETSNQEKQIKLVIQDEEEEKLTSSQFLFSQPPTRKQSEEEEVENEIKIKNENIVYLDKK